jgi:hypothetical protein
MKHGKEGSAQDLTIQFDVSDALLGINVTFVPDVLLCLFQPVKSGIDRCECLRGNACGSSPFCHHMDHDYREHCIDLEAFSSIKSKVKAAGCCSGLSGIPPRLSLLIIDDYLTYLPTRFPFFC